MNHELISLYWDIGKAIAENREAAGWGDAIVEKLSRDLNREFPGVRGFSSQNLWQRALSSTSLTPRRNFSHRL